ncbi:MAG TPA: hypothetical protein VJT71_15815 [Pyrinomonadaceae bacterium]|nr:hypothetical protein [Pyrinomonadaceae bacterium]
MKRKLVCTRPLSFTRRIGILATFAILLLLSATNSMAQDQATIQKDSVQVEAFTLNSYKGDFKTWSWIPQTKFRVNGPIPSGSQLFVEFAVPGAPAWVKYDCKTQETQKGYWWAPECGGRDSIPEEKGITYTGPVSFAIKMRNELTGGGDVTLFTGKMKVAKVHSGEAGPNFVNHFDYYVDQDWNLPIGYVFLDPNDGVYGWKRPKLAFALWKRGEVHGSFEPHLFKDGKEVGKMMYEGQPVSVPSCGTSEVEHNTTHIANGQYVWTRMKCEFFSVFGWNKTDESNDTKFGRLHVLSENPGEYEMKILYKGRLVRSFKFSVTPEGKIVDNGIATNNKLGNDRVIVPVQVLGDSDGPWDKNAWKTDAFYGNPLTGFTVGP